jgi:hypothetical protein
VQVAVGDDGDGRLVFHKDRLVAILVRLSAVQGADAGRWFLEFGFPPLEVPDPPVFPDLETATAWMEARLAI